jgi:hypothetical protein
MALDVARPVAGSSTYKRATRARFSLFLWGRTVRPGSPSHQAVGGAGGRGRGVKLDKDRGNEDPRAR